MAATTVQVSYTGSEEDDSQEDLSESGTTKESTTMKGNKIFSISRDIEDLNYHLASVFPSFTSKQVYASKMTSKPDASSQ